MEKYDLFSEENIIETEHINNQDIELGSQDIFVIKKTDDKDIKTSYGYKYSGSHLQIMEKIKNINNIYDFSIDELDKNINIKNLLEFKLNFNGDLKSNDFAKFLINEKGINLDKAFLIQYLIKNLNKPNAQDVGNYVFGKIYSGDNDIAKEVSSKYKDIISYKTYEKLLNQIEKISLLINDEDNTLNELPMSELLSIINDRIVNKRYKGSSYDITAIQIQELFKYSYRQERELLVNNLKGENNSDFIRKDFLNKALTGCMSNLKYNFNNARRLGDKALNDINICFNVFSKFNELPDTEKSLHKIITLFLNQENVGFDIPMYKDIYKFTEKDVFLSISDYYKEIAIKDFPNLESCFKYYDLIIAPSKVNEDDLLFYANKRRNVAAVKKLPDSYKFKVQDVKEGIGLLGLSWQNNIDSGLFGEKIKINTYKSTGNKNLNNEVFIEKYPELIPIINNKFNIDINKELKNHISSHDILLNAGVKGIELGKTLKNKENVLLNVIACSAVLSNTLNVSISDLFLNNSLGIAIGSRGRGKALAHFEKVNNLIHTTQKNEFASFSHEFAHAIDSAIGTLINNEMSNMIYQQAKTNFSMERNLMLIDPTEFNENNLKSKKIITEVYYLKEAFRDSDILLNSIKEDSGKQISYWSSHIELFARTFETFISDSLNNLKMPNIGTHGNDYYSTSKVYPSEQDKEKLYPIIKNIISLYSEYSKDIALQRSNEVNKHLDKEQLEIK